MARAQAQRLRVTGVRRDYAATRDHAEAMDREDDLATLRDEFNFPRSVAGGLPSIYLCGNSLGLQPRRAVRYVQEELADWGRLAVEGHHRARRPWLPYHRLATPGLARLAGALPREVVAMNTLTVNLHLLLARFYQPDSSRYRILIESTAFPSDRFAAVSQIRMRGFDPDDALVEWAPRAGESDLRLEDLESTVAAYGDSIALMLLPGVQYYNGQLLDMPALCHVARQAGAAIGFDLAHAIGNVPLSLHDWAPDFAAWCSYKYLNGGPGAIAGVFVHDRHLQGDSKAHLLGWWGHDEASRFSMRPAFSAAHGVESWQLSNPPILSLAPVIASLELFDRATIAKLRDKSLRLTGFLENLLDLHLAGQVRSITPPDARGAQLSLLVTAPGIEPRTVFARLEAQQVIADWREPDVIRVAPVPLYNSFLEVFEFVERLRSAIASNTASNTASN
ncbi:MAG: kynureninase [Woeseia sp.]